MTGDGGNEKVPGRRAALEIVGVSSADAQVVASRFTPDEAQVGKWLAKSAGDYQVLGYSRVEILASPSGQDVRLRIEDLIKWARKLESRQAGGSTKELGKRAVVAAQNLKLQVEKDWSGHLQQQKLLLIEEDLKNSCIDDNKLDWDEHLSIYEKAEAHGITRQDVNAILQNKLQDWQREAGATIQVETEYQFVQRTATEFVQHNRTESGVLPDLRRDDLVKAIVRKGIGVGDARRLVDDCLKSLGVRVEAGVWHGALPVGSRQARSLREFHAALVAVDVTTAMDMFKRRAYSPMLRFAGEDEKVVMAVETAENDVARDGILAVLRFCWSTGYTGIFIGKDEARTVEDVVRLCDGKPDKLRDQLTNKKLAVWLEEALGHGKKSPLFRAASDGAARERDADLQCLRWLWLAGENRLQVGGGKSVSSASELLNWTLDAPGRVEFLGKLVKSAWLAAWLEGLASRDSSLSGLVAAAQPANEESSTERAGWNYIWSAGHGSLHLWIKSEHVELSKKQDLAPLLFDPSAEIVALFRQGIVQDWLSSVVDAAEISSLMKALRMDAALKGDPHFAAQYTGWSLFSLPLRWGAASWESLKSLVEQFELDAHPLYQALDADRLLYWLGCRFPQELRSSSETTGDNEKPEIILNCIMWDIGSRILRGRDYRVRDIAEIWNLPAATIEDMVSSDLLPLWLEQVHSNKKMAADVRVAFASSSRRIRALAVCWATGSKSFRVADHNASTIQELLNLADAVRPQLCELIRDGTLGTWLLTQGAPPEVIQHLKAEDVQTRDDVGIDALLEYVLVALGLPPPVLEIEPTTVLLGRIPEGTSKTIDIAIKNVGSRGSLWATVTASDSAISPDKQGVTAVACGNEAHLVFTLSIPVGGVSWNHKVSLSVVSNGGRAEIPVKVSSGIAWGHVLGPSLGLGAVVAVVAGGMRSGISSMVDDVLAKNWVNHATEVGVVPAVLLLLAGAGYALFRHLGKDQ